MSFDEKLFLLTLLNRPEDAKRFSQSFDPEWLQDAHLKPLLVFINRFVKAYDTGPSINALEKYLKDEEPEAYLLRYQSTINELKGMEQPDFSLMVYTSRKAKEITICRSFLSMQLAANGMIAEEKGDELLKEVQKWIHKFYGLDEDLTLDFREATNYLLEQYGKSKSLEPVETGIMPLDLWSGNGLWPKNLGIVVAPTGHGKSVILMNAAANMAVYSKKRVWFLTNELDMEEQTQRFLSYLQNHPISQIQQNPLCVFGPDLDNRWELEGLDKHLLITSVNREISTEDIEAELIKLINLQGYAPDVLALDFMERMKPVTSGYSRD